MGSILKRGNRGRGGWMGGAVVAVMPQTAGQRISLSGGVDERWWVKETGCVLGLFFSFFLNRCGL